MASQIRPGETVSTDPFPLRLQQQGDGPSLTKRRCAIMMRMTRTTVDVDDRALAAARRELGTKGLSETVNAALREATRRRIFRDFDVRRDIDGTPREVREGR
jgi:Arc/MetJ family transcription regulator